MRRLFLTIVLICFSRFAFGQTDSLRQDSIRERAPWEKIDPKPTKFIYIYRVNDDAAWLFFRNGGYGLLTLFPTRVIGTFAVEENGFRFTPAKEAPKGMMPQKLFDRFYMMNSLVKGMFIPYSEMKKVRLYNGIIFRTKNGKRYRFLMKRPKKVWREIRSHLNTSKPDK
jgi:hypothetical protein